MRINVYAEELTDEVSVTTKTVTDNEFGTRTFYGIRFYLKSPDALHYGVEDDDRSAITIWVPWTKAQGHTFELVEDLFVMLERATQEAKRDAYNHRSSVVAPIEDRPASLALVPPAEQLALTEPT